MGCLHTKKGLICIYTACFAVLKQIQKKQILMKSFK